MLSRIDWGNLVWGLLLLGAFLIPEVLGWIGVAPWPTLSQTAWADEARYHILKTILAGFLFGLAVHIRFTTPLGHAIIGGLIVATAAHFFWSV